MNRLLRLMVVIADVVAFAVAICYLLNSGVFEIDFLDLPEGSGAGVEFILSEGDGWILPFIAPPLLFLILSVLGRGDGIQDVEVDDVYFQSLSSYLVLDLVALIVLIAALMDDAFYFDEFIWYMTYASIAIVILSYLFALIESSLWVVLRSTYACIIWMIVISTYIDYFSLENTPGCYEFLSLGMLVITVATAIVSFINLVVGNWGFHIGVRLSERSDRKANKTKKMVSSLSQQIHDYYDCLEQRAHREYDGVHQVSKLRRES